MAGSLSIPITAAAIISVMALSSPDHWWVGFATLGVIPGAGVFAYIGHRVEETLYKRLDQLNAIENAYRHGRFYLPTEF